MNTRPQFRSVFPADKPVVLIVIHVNTADQAVRCVDAVRGGGADGCFLIQHDGNAPLLRKAYRDVRYSHPSFWVGLNFLGEPPLSAATLAADAAEGSPAAPLNEQAPRPFGGLWVDKPLAIEHFRWEAASNRGPCPEGYLDIHAPDISPHVGGSVNMLPQSLYFAGAGFKYQRDKGVPLAQECQIVARRADVVTTSGDRTGSPPTLEKMAAVRAAVGPGVPVAIASGVSARNVRQFLPTTQAFLVATNVTGPGDMTDEDLVRELVEAAKS